MLLGLLKICDIKINYKLANCKVIIQEIHILSKQKKKQYRKHFQVTQTLPQMSHK